MNENDWKNDCFYEQGVRAEDQSRDNAVSAACAAGAVILLVLAVAAVIVWLIPGNIRPLTVAAVLVPAALAAALLVLRGRTHVEYDYTLTNADLDFARVRHFSHREELASLNLSAVEAFGKLAGAAADQEAQRWYVNPGAPLYYMKWQAQDGKREAVFEPDEQMVAAIRTRLPQGAWQEQAKEA